MLRLRPYKSSDAQYILHWMNEERAFAMWSAGNFQYPLTFAQLEKYKEKYENDENAWPMTALNESGMPVGHFSMRLADYQKNSIHCGFIIVDPEIRGKGYGKEMLNLAVKYAFEILNVRRITLCVYDTNPSAHHCYQSIGFLDENFHREAFSYRDEKWGIYDMAIEKSDRNQAGKEESL